MQIKGLSVLVTGGASGMGAATASYLKQLGAKVAIMDLDKKQVKALADNLQCLGIVCDVVNEKNIIRSLDEIKQVQGIPKACVHCAGILHANRVISKKGVMPLAAFNRVIQVNLIGTFNINRLLAEQMIKEPEDQEGERGVFINTASIAAFEGQIGQAAYSASKAGVVGMMLPIAREFARFGIRVMTIAPGLVETPMLASLSEEVQDSLKSTCIFPKRLVQPNEFARLAAHIIENSSLNGEVIRLDGAIRLQPV